MYLIILFFFQSYAFKSVSLKVCNHPLKVEIADTDELKALGLMNRASLPENSGMLFVYENEEYLSFWMKNTKIPLSIAFFDKNKKLVDIQDMKPMDTSIIYKSKKPAQFAIETNKGWFSKKKIEAKSRCQFEYDY